MCTRILEGKKGRGKETDTTIIQENFTKQNKTKICKYILKEVLFGGEFRICNTDFGEEGLLSQ